MKTAKKYAYMVMLVLAIACLGGCYQGANYYYMNSEKYTAGDVEITEKIDTIYIDYSAGNVEVIRNTSGTTKIAETSSREQPTSEKALMNDNSSTDEKVSMSDKLSTIDEEQGTSKEEQKNSSGVIRITETASKELNEDQMVHTWVDGSILYVKYCASKKGIDMRNLNKKLKIEIPADYAFEMVNVSVSSANASLENLESKNIQVTASSGNINVSGIANAVGLSASSGNIVFGQQGEMDKVKLTTSSGCVTTTIEKTENLEIRTSSGDIQVDAGNITTFDLNSSSGACEVRFLEAAQKAKVDTSSGNVRVYFPENPDLKANVRTSSGKFYYDISFTKEGDAYINGDGNHYIEVSTSSGDVDFLRN